MRFACWITNVTDKYSECVILIALHGHFFLRDRTTVLRLRTFPACECVSCFQNMAEFQILFWFSPRPSKRAFVNMLCR